MRMLSRVIALVFLLFPLISQAQTDVLRDRRVDPVLKQVAAKRPGLHIYSRNDGKEGYVNMAVLDDSTRQLKWFTCHGVVFDAVQLREDEYSQLAAGMLEPFSFYRNYCYESLYYIEQAELLYRMQGKKALEDTTHNNRIIFNTPAVKSAETTLQKLMAIEGLMKGICLRLRAFDSMPPRLLTKYRNDSSRARRELAGAMIRKADSTEYYNTDAVAGASRIVLRRQSPDRLFVYDQEGALMDSVPLKPGKYAALLQEKEDVFLLYRGWLELQWQQAVDNRQQYVTWLRKLDSSLYRPASWSASRRQIRNDLVNLQEQQNAVSDKISRLIVPESKYAEQLIANSFREETSEISYLPGLGFAYSVSFMRGQKVYELTDHRGNVMAVVSDKKKSVDEDANGAIDYYNADVVSANDYYPFGMLQPGRQYSAGDKYRYGYNGKENDNEIKGEGNQQDYGMRIYDPRVGRFLSVDPLTRGYPELTPYQFASNRPIDGIDLDGLEFTPGTFDYKHALYLGNLTLSDDKKLEQKQIEVWGNAMNEGQRKGRLAGAALAVDMYTGGKLSFYTGIFGAFWHNASTTSEGRADQAEQSREALLAAGISWGSGKLLNNLLKAIPRKSPLLPIRTITVIEEDGYAVVRDAEGMVAGRGWLTQGELNLTIKTKGTTLNGRGAEVFEEIYNYINKNFDEIQSIRGNWKAGDLGDNLKTFNELVDKLGPEEAAMKTFTGKMVERLKFNRAEVTLGPRDVNGNYQSVDVIFKKK